MVRGGVTICLAVAVALVCARGATAQFPAPIQGAAVERVPLRLDALVSPVPAVPPRTAFQLPPQPGSPEQPGFTLPEGSIIPTPAGKARQYRFTRRYGTPNNIDSQLLPDTSRRFVFTGGVIVNVTGEKNNDETEFATDDAVVWVRGKPVDDIQNGFNTDADGKTEVEVYMTGNVVVRTKSKDGPLQTVRASQVYYDVQKEKAVALAATLEYLPLKSQDAIRIRGQEIRRLDMENWEALEASFDSSKLPSDPGIRIDSRRVTLSQRKVQLRNVFGIPYRDLLTGAPVEGDEKLLTAYDAVPKVAGVPVFYLPRLRTDATDPLGPFVNLSFGQGRQFGFQTNTTWDIFELLALRPPPGQKWHLNLDYLSARGPAAGTDYVYNLPATDTGLSAPNGFIKAYGIKDDGVDILGGDRGLQAVPPNFRGRVTWQHQQEIIEGLYYQGQISYLSDQNFLEQFYNQEFDLRPNQETYANLNYTQKNYGIAALVEYRLDRAWNAETQWLPRLDANLTGQSFFDLFVYSGRASAGYAQARPSDANPFPVLSTDKKIDTGRINFMQELSVPFGLGPLKLAPYGTVDLAGYSNDLNGSAVGRVWGGGGARASLPLSRLYEGVASDLFNIRGLYHKVVFGANYLYARTNVSYTQLPYLDRLNDDATDQAFRQITPMQPQYVSGPNGFALAGAGNPGSVYDPQAYAIRRLVLNKVDTLDNINVLQMDVRQRLQTKRGYPGLEHTVDVLNVGLSASYFPDATRDNFGHPFSFLEYDATWNIGDRTSLVSTAWFEPYTGGSRHYTVGAYLNRTDRTNFYVGYRQIDPLNSQAVSASVAYQLSHRYALNASASYDFGIQQALSNSLLVTRTGTDLTVSLGFTYNSLVNNFGVQFMITPNLVAAMNPNAMAGGQSGGGAQGTGRGR